jgi:hypothetical protein
MAKKRQEKSDLSSKKVAEYISSTQYYKDVFLSANLGFDVVWRASLLQAFSIKASAVERRDYAVGPSPGLSSMKTITFKQVIGWNALNVFMWPFFLINLTKNMLNNVINKLVMGGDLSDRKTYSSYSFKTRVGTGLAVFLKAIISSLNIPNIIFSLPNKLAKAINSSKLLADIELDQKKASDSDRKVSRIQIVPRGSSSLSREKYVEQNSDNKVKRFLPRIKDAGRPADELERNLLNLSSKIDALGKNQKRWNHIDTVQRRLAADLDFISQMRNEINQLPAASAKPLAALADRIVSNIRKEQNALFAWEAKARQEVLAKPKCDTVDNEDHGNRSGKTPSP